MRIPIKGILAFLFLGTVAASLQAAAPVTANAGTAEHIFIVRVDLENGLALIPEGTVIPNGVKIYVNRVDGEPRVSSEHAARTGASVDSAPTPAGRPLVFAYAPDADFADARGAIAAARAQAVSHRLAEDRFRLAANFTEEQYYVFFPDGYYGPTSGSRMAVVKYSFDANNPPNYNTDYFVQTSVYSANTGTYDYADLLASQNSFDYPSLNSSNQCSVGDTGGGCDAPLQDGFTTSVSSQPSTTVSCSGRISQVVTSDGCGIYGYKPCKQVYTGTIQVPLP